MPRRASSHPTAAELEVLSVLWRHGAATVRQVHETLQADRRTALTTTLKLLQVMTGKGLVIREAGSRPHRYRPAATERKTQSRLLADLARRAFDGSVRKLLVRAVEDGELTNKELREIRKLIDTVRKDKRGGK